MPVLPWNRRRPATTALFETTVDGNDVRALGLRGKPAPDGFLEATRRLGVAPKRAIVVEEALSGVSAGADLVVDDLAELVPLSP